MGPRIITEAGRAVVRRLRETGIPYPTATHDGNNPRSGAVMKRLGMRCRYSCEEPWRPKDILVTSVCIGGTLMEMRRGHTKSIEKIMLYNM